VRLCGQLVMYNCVEPVVFKSRVVDQRRNELCFAPLLETSQGLRDSTIKICRLYGIYGSWIDELMDSIIICNEAHSLKANSGGKLINMSIYSTGRQYGTGRQGSNQTHMLLTQ
jgi:hypothetical protein